MIGGTELAFADLGLSLVEPGSGLLAAQRAFLEQSSAATGEIVLALTG
jgi:hypothetical protein